MTRPCVFCRRAETGEEVLARNDLAIAFLDGFPISPGHTLIVPIRHEPDYFNLTTDEQTGMWELTNEMQQNLSGSHNPDAFNIGINTGPAAGQTIGHTHLHLIPRYNGDHDDPRGGVRWIIPDKAKYWED